MFVWVITSHLFDGKGNSSYTLMLKAPPPAGLEFDMPVNTEPLFHRHFIARCCGSILLLASSPSFIISCYFR